MGTLSRSCAKVHEPIELSFGVMSGFCQGTGHRCIRWGSTPQREGEVLGFYAPIGLNGRWRFEWIRLVCEKFKYFHMDNVSLQTSVHWLSEDAASFEIEVGVYAVV